MAQSTIIWLFAQKISNDRFGINWNSSQHCKSHTESVDGWIPFIYRVSRNHPKQGRLFLIDDTANFVTIRNKEGSLCTSSLSSWRWRYSHPPFSLGLNGGACCLPIPEGRMVIPNQYRFVAPEEYADCHVCHEGFYDKSSLEIFLKSAITSFLRPYCVYKYVSIVTGV